MYSLCSVVKKKGIGLPVAGKARRLADQVSSQLQAIENEFDKIAATKSLRMAERMPRWLSPYKVMDSSQRSERQGW